MRSYRRTSSPPCSHGMRWKILRPAGLGERLGYGLGLMLDTESPVGPAIGHSGLGPGRAAAVYHFPAVRPARTVAVFAAGDSEGPVETRALVLAASSTPKNVDLSCSGRAAVSRTAVLQNPQIG